MAGPLAEAGPSGGLQTYGPVRRLIFKTEEILIHIYINTYIYRYIYIYIHICIYIDMYLYVHIYICIYVNNISHMIYYVDMSSIAGNQILARWCSVASESAEVFLGWAVPWCSHWLRGNRGK